MASSSDESFAWTDASNSSESSIENQKMTKYNGSVNGLNEDSESDASCKKKLHKKLLINNDDDNTFNEELQRGKKGKRKRMDDDNIESPKKKKIKLEPSSDPDTPKKKKKHALIHSQSNETYDRSNEDISQNDSDLNITVKQEPGLLSPSHKSKKKGKIEVNTSTHSNNDLDETNIATENYDAIHPADNDETYTSKKKKKKSKKERSSQSDDNDVNTVIKFSKNTDSYPEHIRDIKHSIVKNESFMHKSEVSSLDENSNDNNSDLSAIDDPSNISNHRLKSHKSINNSTLEKQSKRVSFISNKIKYEDRDNSQMDHSINSEVDKTNSRKLKKFLKVNENLKPVSTSQQSDWVLNPDDEVWAIKCPKNIDINAFLGINIKLDKKCKIKVEGQTYEGTMNKETDSITVLTLQNSNYIIKRLPLNGIVNLRKRIPKVHIQENNDTPDNQLDFVPLPTTKKRHPLFGSDYKKAMKVPSAIAQRLKDPYNDTCENENKKSKKKKHKNKSIDIDREQLEKSQEIVPESEENPVKIKKKNRKRKHETESELSNTKRAKHSDSTAVWESEQAIEENLFNF